jgi:hypothetical protein
MGSDVTVITFVGMIAARENGRIKWMCLGYQMPVSRKRVDLRKAISQMLGHPIGTGERRRPGLLNLGGPPNVSIQVSSRKSHHRTTLLGNSPRAPKREDNLSLV